MRDDLYSDGREVIVESERADEGDDTSEIEEEARGEESSLSPSLTPICGRENIGGRGKDTETRRRSRYSGFLGVTWTLGLSLA